MTVFRLGDRHKKDKINFLKRHWGTTEMVVSVRRFDMTALDGFIVYGANGEVSGLVTFIVYDNKECEIISLNSEYERQGIGTALIQSVIEEARRVGCSKVKLITTNDNIIALLFYQRKGFDMVELCYDMIKESRKIRPQIPEHGYWGIPLKHEIRFEYLL
ncbi:MAG: GNAT family N-acetyltransferase [Oscillospiraceae bacterium]|nr:GNAT family N-acetyltransferase [Oscillospiraceae bacterium]